MADHDIRQKFVMSLLLLLAGIGPEFRMYTYVGSYGTLIDFLVRSSVRSPLLARRFTQLW